MIRTHRILLMALALLVAARGPAADTAIGVGRRDIVRKVLEFFRVEVPSENGERIPFGLTVIETFGDDLQWVGGRARRALRHDLMVEALEWFLPRLQQGREPLQGDFARFLREDPTLETSRNTWLILSDPNDFSNIQAMVRLAKGPTLPIEHQFRGKLREIPRPGYQPVPDNQVRIFSFRHEEPHRIVMQNAPVYSGDVVEVKHYAAARRHDVDLTALLFHLGQDLGVFSISRFVPDGRELGLPRGPAIITPSRIVAGSDTPGLLALLKRGCHFVTHQELGEAVRSGAPTEVVIGTPEQLGEGLRAWHQSRPHSWQLSEISLTPATTPEFLSKFLHRGCEALYSNLSQLDRSANQQLEDVVRRFGRPLR